MFGLHDGDRVSVSLVLQPNHLGRRPLGVGWLGVCGECVRCGFYFPRVGGGYGHFDVWLWPLQLAALIYELRLCGRI